MADATLRIELADEGGPGDLRPNPDLDAAMRAGEIPMGRPVGIPHTASPAGAQQIQWTKGMQPPPVQSVPGGGVSGGFNTNALGAAIGIGIGVAIADRVTNAIGDQAIRRAPELARAGASTSITQAEVANAQMGEEMLRFAEQIPILGGFAKMFRAGLEATTAALNQGAKEITFAAQQLANRISLDPLAETLAATRKRVEELEKIDTYATRQQAARIRRDELAPLEARQTAEQALRQRGETLRRFSPEASAAFAQARVADIQLAQRQAADLGPRLAEFYRVQQALRESQQERQRAQVNADLFRQIEQVRLEEAINRMALSFEDSKIRLEAADVLREREAGRNERFQKFMRKYIYLIHEVAKEGLKKDAKPPFEKQLEDLRKGLAAAEREGRGVNDLPDPAPFNVPAFGGF